jgi:hypothetical protein
MGLPDPLDRGTDPGIRIRTKMSQIHNTAQEKSPALQTTYRKVFRKVKFLAIFLSGGLIWPSWI